MSPCGTGRCSIKRHSLKLAFKAPITWTACFSRWPLLAFWDREARLSQPTACITTQASGPSDVGEVLLEVSAQCEEDDPPFSLETRACFSCLPVMEPPGSGEQRTSPGWHSHFKFYRGSCSQRRKSWSQINYFFKHPREPN